MWRETKPQSLKEVIYMNIEIVQDRSEAVLKAYPNVGDYPSLNRQTPYILGEEVILHSKKDISGKGSLSGKLVAFSLIASASALQGCATPQERAILAFCESQAYQRVPQKLVNQQVYRSIYVGDRVIGSRNVCKTETKNQPDGKGGGVKTTETVCQDEPITQPVFENRLVMETVDLNLYERQNQVKVCTSDALAKNMFSHIR